MPEEITNLENIAKLEAGDLNLSLDELTGAAVFCLKIGAKTNSVLAVVVAKARAEFIQDTAQWVEWCRENFALEGNYLHRLHKIGRMLLECIMIHSDKFYNKIFELDWEKQYTLSRIPVKQIAGFVSGLRKPIDKMTRGELRVAVSEYLGETAKTTEVGDQLELPGFGKALDTVVRLEPAQLVKAVNDEQAASQSFRAGCLLLGATLDYQRRQPIPDVRLLTSLKAGLLDEIKAIEDILAKEI